MMNNEKLYALCKRYGENALYFRRKFMGLLPEVHKRRLYEKKGFGSIFEFAAKLCGVSEDQVRRVLNLEKKFEEMPVLKEMLVSGEVSAGKLARVASIATPDNAEVLASQVKLLPQRALETLVRDEKFANTEGLQKPNNRRTSLCSVRAVRAHITEPRLDDDVKQQLSDLQEKGIDINFLIREMLEKREMEISSEKNAVAEKELAKAAKRVTARESEETLTAQGGVATKNTQKPQKPSRYISVKVKKILKEEHGDKCSIPHCNKPATQIHHTQRFALAGAHDPRYMAPLCEEHHKIAHAIDQKVQVAKSEKWRHTQSG